MQKVIFEEPEDGVRKIVLATNIAETSITIDDVVFVLDCGKAKETSYDALNNAPCLLPTWISKASAHQVMLYFCYVSGIDHFYNMFNVQCCWASFSTLSIMYMYVCMYIVKKCGWA